MTPSLRPQARERPPCVQSQVPSRSDGAPGLLEARRASLLDHDHDHDHDPDPDPRPRPPTPTPTPTPPCAAASTRSHPRPPPHPLPHASTLPPTAPAPRAPRPSRTGPCPDARSPLVPPRAEPPGTHARPYAHARWSQAAVPRGVPLLGDLGCHGRQRARFIEAPPSAHGASAPMLNTRCNRYAPLVRGIAFASPPHSARGPGGHVPRGHLVLRLVPLRGDLRLERTERIRTRHALVPTEGAAREVARPLTRRRGPHVLFAPRAPPPHDARGAGDDARGRQRLVPRRVPLRGDGRETGGEAVRRGDAAPGTEGAAVPQRRAAVRRRRPLVVGPHRALPPDARSGTIRDIVGRQDAVPDRMPFRHQARVVGQEAHRTSPVVGDSHGSR